jgi:hypothetical protein
VKSFAASALKRKLFCANPTNVSGKAAIVAATTASPKNATPGLLVRTGKNDIANSIAAR